MIAVDQNLPILFILLTITVDTIQSYEHSTLPNRQGHERTWFQMSIPYLDTTIQFQPPSGFEPDRLFDLMNPFGKWNPMEPPPFMRPFFERPNHFRPMMSPIPPPPGLSPFNPSSEPTTSAIQPSTSDPNAISEPEPQSTFSVSSSVFSPSRRRYKPRWQPHHPRRPSNGKRPESSVRGGGNGYGYGGSSNGGGSGSNGCRHSSGTKGGRKCHPGQRFWEKTKPSSHPNWPFFIFPPPRPSMSGDDDKPKVPNTFTEVTKTDDPACGNRHLPRPTKPESSAATTTTTTPSIVSTTMVDNNERNNVNVNNSDVNKESSPSSTTTTTTESPLSSANSADIEPSSFSSSSSVQPSLESSSTSSGLTPSEVSKSSNVEPEKGGNPSESESSNGPKGNREGPGNEEDDEKDGKRENLPESSSVSYLPKESEKDEGTRERTNINNEEVSSSGLMTTMGPLETLDTSEDDGKKKTKETKKKDNEERKDDDDDNDKKKIESKGKADENVDDEADSNNGNNKKPGKEEDETVDLKYSPGSTSASDASDLSPSSPPSPSLSSSEPDVTTLSASSENVKGESVTTMSSTDLSNIDSINEADTVPNENDKGSTINNSESASPDESAKRKREAEKEQFIKQIESMSIEEFRKLATRIASLSV